jgi:type I restriction enzyme M protein
MFYGSTIATCILVLKKSKSDNKTMFIDATKEFTKAGKFKVMREEHRVKVLEAFANRSDSDHFARLVDNSEVVENAYNLSVTSYVAQEGTREVVNITDLNADIEHIVTRQAVLRAAIDEIVRDLESSK